MVTDRIIDYGRHEDDDDGKIAVSHAAARLTAVDLLLQKTDQSAHVPFEHEFKVGSMSRRGGTGKHTLTHTRRKRSGPKRAALDAPVFVHRSVIQLTHEENARSARKSRRP